MSKRMMYLVLWSTMMFVPSFCEATTINAAPEATLVDGMTEVERLNSVSEHVRVKQIDVTKQKGHTCGNYAVFNAMAVQELCSEGKGINSASIKDRAGDFVLNMKKSDHKLTYIDVHELGTCLMLKNAHIIAMNQGTKQFYSAGGIHVEEENLDQFFKQMCGSKDALSHFILNYDEHWVTVSVEKRQGEITIMLFNSTNAPLHPEQLSYVFIKELVYRLS